MDTIDSSAGHVGQDTDASYPLNDRDFAFLWIVG